MVRPEARRERSLALFALGLLIFSPAIISIFNRDVLVFGLPLPFLYLFAAWIALIGLMALNAIAMGDEDREQRRRPRASARPPGRRL